MVLRSTTKYDLTRIIDPTIELWSADDPFELPCEQAGQPTVDYWFNARELDFFQKSELPLNESSCIFEETTPTSAADLSSFSPSGSSREHTEFDFDYSLLVVIKEFWTLQNKSLTSGLDNFHVIAFRQFWKTQNYFVSTGLQDSALIAARGFLSVQKSLLHTGPSDGILLLARNFWNVQESVAVFGITDAALLTFEEFWELQNHLISKADKDPKKSVYQVFSKINGCFRLCAGPSTMIDDNLVASLQNLHINMAITLQRKELNFEMIDKFKREDHLKEVTNLNKIIEKLKAENLQWINSQQAMAKQLAQKNKQLEVISSTTHSVDLELANEELNRKWSQARAQLKIADSIETENYKLISTNAKLTSEKQRLISRFTERQDKLISSNANLHALVLTLEKAVERNFDESRQLQNIIEMLRKKDAKSCSPPSSTHSTHSDFGIEITRSRGSRGGKSLSKKSNSSSLHKAYVETSLVPPASAGMIYVNS